MKWKFITLALLLMIVSTVYSKPDKGNKDVSLGGNPSLIDSRVNSIGNIQGYFGNNGISWLDQYNNKMSGVWPKASTNGYLFGSGLWIAGKKMLPEATEYKKVVSLTYSPNTGVSWFVPGTYQDTSIYQLVNSSSQNFDTYNNKYKMYFSTEMNLQTGEALSTIDRPNWPLWLDNSTYQYVYGSNSYQYVNSTIERNSTNFPLGPLFVSNQDIVAVFCDADLNQHEGGAASRKLAGYPLGLEIIQSVYTWDSLDAVVISYMIKNVSNDTLIDCWIGNLADIDIRDINSTVNGAANDHLNYYYNDSTLNMLYAWTDTTAGEGGKWFGYLGVALIETPAVVGSGNMRGYIREDQKVYTNDEQLGLVTTQSWSIAADPISDEQRYDWLAAGIKDTSASGDVRGLLSTGPFNFGPATVARFTVAYFFATPANGGEADGTISDITGLDGKKNKTLGNAGNTSLIEKAKAVREAYYHSAIISQITEQKSEQTISLYPNPTNTALSINSQNMNGYYYEVLSLSGVKVQSGYYFESINVEALNTGVYFLKIDGHSYGFIKK